MRYRGLSGKKIMATRWVVEKSKNEPRMNPATCSASFL